MEVDPQQEGEVAPFSGMGAGIGGTMFREVTELSEKWVTIKNLNVKFG